MKDNKWPDTSKSKYYPFNDVIDLGYNWIIINGIINDGKTYGAKEWALQYHLDTGKKVMYLFNSASSMKDTVDEFINSNVNNNPKWKSFTTKEISKSKWKGYIDDNEAFIFRLITTKNRGERDGDNIGAIIYDEFNLIDSRVNNLQLKSFKNIMTRPFEYLEYMILIGNAVTLNNPILFDLGIMEIKDEFTEFDIEHPLTGEIFKGLFHNFKRSQDQLAEKYRGNIFAAYLFSGEFGEHAFANKFLLDDMNNVINIPQEVLNKQAEIKDIYKYGNSWIFHYKFTEDKKTVSYFQMRNKITKKESLLNRYAIDKDNLDEGIKFVIYKLVDIGYQIQVDKVYYQNIATKQAIRKAVKPHLNW